MSRRPAASSRASRRREGPTRSTRWRRVPRGAERRCLQMIGMGRAADGQAPERAPAYLRVPEAAQVMNMSVRGVYREIESGRLRKTLKRGTRPTTSPSSGPPRPPRTPWRSPWSRRRRRVPSRPWRRRRSSATPTLPGLSSPRSPSGCSNGSSRPQGSLRAGSPAPCPSSRPSGAAAGRTSGVSQGGAQSIGLAGSENTLKAA